MYKKGAKIEALKERIKTAENEKKQIISLVQNLTKQIQKRAISYDQFQQKIKNTLGDKTAEQWIKKYDEEINLARYYLKQYEKQLQTKRILAIFILAPIVITIILIIIVIKVQQIILLSPVTNEIIALNDVWKYEDTNTDLPDSWTTQAYDDSTWPQGPAKLGFGDNDGVFGTTLQNLNQITVYFRKNFTIEDISKIESMNISIDYDDCYAIYLNGIMLANSTNFVSNAHATPCSSVHNSIDDGSGATAPIFPTIYFTPQQISLLQNGQNMLAVEIHQQSAISPDIVMQLSMYASLRQDDGAPNITIHTPQNNTVIQDITPLVNFSVTEPAQITYSLDNGQTNITFCQSCSSGYFYLYLPEAQHTLTLFARDLDMNNNSQSTTFAIDLQNKFIESFDDNSSIMQADNLTFNVGLISLAPSVLQTTLLFQGTTQIDDAEIRSNAQNTNFGNANTIQIDSNGPHAHSLIKFPTFIGQGANQIPLGAKIINATLSSFCTNSGNNQTAYLLLENWTENQVTWNQRQIGTPWQVAGAENPPSRDNSFSQTFTCTTTNQRITTNVTSFFEKWVNNTPNHGIVLIDTGNNNVVYSSSETANTPILTVTFETPKASSGFLQSLFINTSRNISTITEINWTENNTNQNNNITAEIFNGTGWQPVQNHQSIPNLNFNTLAYRVFFTIQSQNITLKDISIFWQSQQDTSPPIITITSPIQNQIFTTSEVFFEISTNELSSCNYSLDNGQTNTTFITLNNINFNASEILSNNLYTINFFCTDTSRNQNNTESRNFEVNAANTPPSITDISTIPDQTITESSITPVTFSVLASDTLVADLNHTSIEAIFSFPNYPEKKSLCSHLNNINTTTANYSCIINIEYFDAAGVWNVSASIKDLQNGQSSYYNESFLLLETTCITLAPSAITFPQLFPNDVNIPAINNPIVINNTCNDNIPINEIKITAKNIYGIQDSTEYLPADRFKIHTTNSCTDGTRLQNGTIVAVANSILPAGNNSLNYKNETSGQEELYLCLENLPSQLKSQQYSTSIAGSWEISVLFVVFIPRRKRKKKNIVTERNLLEILNTQLQKNYHISLNKLLKEIKQEKHVEIPLSIFEYPLPPLELICKYLKENCNYRFSEIAEILNRDQRTIWTSYHKAIEKLNTTIEPKHTIKIPSSVLQKQDLSILESIISYLRNKNLSNAKIAKILKRDPRNIHSMYRRAIKKMEKRTQ